MVKSTWSRQPDELGVLISLAIALGMVIGAGAVMWIWSALSEGTEPVMFLRALEMP